LSNILLKAETLASKMPRIILSARKTASQLTLGLHGRKKAGMGEEFWQFRRFDPSEDMRNIDWRRSARDNHYSVRERELEVAHRFNFYPDLSLSMQFGTPDKAEIAVIMTLVLADIFNDGGEKIALAGHTNAFSSRNMIEDMAGHITRADLTRLPPVTKGELIVLTDSFGDLDALNALMKTQKTHVIVINDIVEETFPYLGRVQFEEREESLKYDAGKAESLKEAYLAKLAEHRSTLKENVKKTGGTIDFYVTNQPIASFLLQFLERMQNA
jgi:uncharacterized protein (DUF58 family)